MASENRNKYYLAIVKNLEAIPEIHFIKDPFGELKPIKNMYTTLQVNWTVSKKELENYG